MQPPLFHFAQMRNELGERSTLTAQDAAETLQQLSVGEVLELPEVITLNHGASIHQRFSSPAVPRRYPIARAKPRTMQIIANASHVAASVLQGVLSSIATTRTRASPPTQSSDIGS